LGLAGKPFFFQDLADSDVGAPSKVRDHAPDGPAPFCGSMAGSPGGILFPPMLFPRNALPSGPRVCFRAEKRFTKVKVGPIHQLTFFGTLW
jgi:hypothetical protein